jgi:hypothetical protein
MIKQTIAAALLATCLLMGSTVLKVSRADSSERKGSSDGIENKREVLWDDPADIESRDLYYGIGGREGAPDPSGRFTFIRREGAPDDTSEKIVVEDDQGRSWTVKFGPEARPETAATRIVWAVGYHVDQDYFVKRAHIEGRGGFDVWGVRFERDDDGFKKVGRWDWNSNPFIGTRELEGLKTLMALLNNADVRTENNKTVRPKKSRDSNKHIYYVNDLGATLGTTGRWLSKLPILDKLPLDSKGILEDYADHKFIDGMLGGEVIFHIKRRQARHALKGVKVENARWMGNLLARLSDKQLTDAFRASGFNEPETVLYIRAIRERIKQLQTLE